MVVLAAHYAGNTNVLLRVLMSQTNKERERVKDALIYFYLSTYLSISLFISLPTYLPIYWLLFCFVVVF